MWVQLRGEMEIGEEVLETATGRRKSEAGLDSVYI